MAVAQAQADIRAIQATYATYQQALTNNSATSATAGTAERDIAEKELVLKDLIRQEDTLDQQFLDQRAAPAPQTFFARLGFGTTQDWVLAFFFFAYSVMALAITGLLLVISTEKIRLGATAVLAFGVLGVVIALLLRMVG
jgi:hypothetical protein